MLWLSKYLKTPKVLYEKYQMNNILSIYMRRFVCMSVCVFVHS